MPVPVGEVRVFGDVALGLDPLKRPDLYITRGILLSDSHGVRGVGRAVRAGWAAQYPEYLRSGSGGDAAPRRCPAAHLLENEPVDLEVCNGEFRGQRHPAPVGPRARDSYEQLLDP